MTTLRILIVLALIAAGSGCGRERAQVDDLIDRIGEQTGHTDGYAQHMRFDIDRHDPAKSLIASPHAIVNDHVLAALRSRPSTWLDGETAARWPGRASSYALTRGDALVCVLLVTGGQRESDFLATRIRDRFRRAETLRGADGDVAGADTATWYRLTNGISIDYLAYCRICDRIGVAAKECRAIERE